MTPNNEPTRDEYLEARRIVFHYTHNREMHEIFNKYAISSSQKQIDCVAYIEATLHEHDKLLSDQDLDLPYYVVNSLYEEADDNLRYLSKGHFDSIQYLVENMTKHIVNNYTNKQIEEIINSVVIDTRCFSDEPWDRIDFLRENEEIDSVILEFLSKDDDGDVRKEVAEHPQVTGEILSKLSKDKYEDTKIAALEVLASWDENKDLMDFCKIGTDKVELTESKKGEER